MQATDKAAHAQKHHYGQSIQRKSFNKCILFFTLLERDLQVNREMSKHQLLQKSKKKKYYLPLSLSGCTKAVLELLR